MIGKLIRIVLYETLKKAYFNGSTLNNTILILIIRLKSPKASYFIFINNILSKFSLRPEN